MKRVLREIGIVVKVTEQRDGESLQANGPALKGDFPTYDSGTIRLDHSGVHGEGSHSSGRRELNEFPSRGKKDNQFLGL
jgi:hypothetical protein